MMTMQTTPEGRTAVEPETGASRPVALMNSFSVPEGRDEVFLELWKQTSEYFRRQPGFRSLRLHRAVTPGAAYRAPHTTDEFRALVTQEAWLEFPSSPVLYEVVLAVGDDALGEAIR